MVYINIKTYKNINEKLIAKNVFILVQFRVFYIFINLDEEFGSYMTLNRFNLTLLGEFLVFLKLRLRKVSNLLDFFIL